MMPKKPTAAAAKLRLRAEEQLQKGQKGRAAKSEKASDDQRLLHELQVHQVELEMQNAELLEARDQLGALLEKYTDLYDFSPVGYFTCDRDGLIQLVNLTGARLAGTDRSNLTGKPFVQLVSAAFRPALRSLLKQAFASDTKQVGDFELMSQGPPRSVNIKAQRSPNGRECSVVVVDITERKQAETKMRVSEIRYRRLFEAAHDGVLLLDPDTRQITDANPFMTTLLGYPKEQLIGKELFEIGLLGDAATSREMFEKLRAEHQIRYEDLPLKNKDGQIQEVEVVANLYEENGHAVIQCNIRDITERKQAEVLLRRNEALFSSLVEQAPVGVYVVDARFRVQQANATTLAFFANAQSLVGRDLSEILQMAWSRRVANRLTARFRHTLKTGEPYWSPTFAERRRDTRAMEFYEWQIQRVTLPTGDHAVVCFFSNVTERKLVEEAQQRTAVLEASNQKLELEIVRRQAVEKSLRQSELEQSHLLKRLRKLSNRLLHVQEEERKRISRELHDVIAQALVGINIDLARLVGDDSTASKDVKKTIAYTQRLVENAIDVVHAFARELRPTMLDNLGLIPSLQSLMKEFMEKTGIRVILKVIAAIEKSDEAIRTALFRIVQEALANVARHAQASRAEVVIQCIKGDICMEIKDNGNGFEVDALAPGKGGKRLGLLGMRERVEMLGGTFSIESSPGKPTTLRVRIPKCVGFGSPDGGGNSDTGDSERS